MSEEVFPRITWEVESKKVMTGTEWQKGAVATLRDMKTSLDWMRIQLKNGVDPTKVLDSCEHWLTVCLYSANMENFKPKEPDEIFRGND